MSRIINDGRIGAITARTGFFISSFQLWREKIILAQSHMEAMIDLGGEVLDSAMVETAAYTLKKTVSSSDMKSIFIRLPAYTDKQNALINILGKKNLIISTGDVFIRPLVDCSRLPKSPFCYWIPDSVMQIVVQCQPFEPAWGKVLVGVQTDNDYRFVRNWLEIPAGSLGASLVDTQRGCGWITFLKGDSTNPFYLDQDVVLNWFGNGIELRAATECAPGGRINNEELYYKPGISWARRTDFFAPHIVPPGCIPSVSRYLAITNDNSNTSQLSLVALFSAPIYDFVAKLQMEAWNGPQFIPGVVRNLPLPEWGNNLLENLSELGQSGLTEARTALQTTETSRVFTTPWGTSSPRSTLREGWTSYMNSLAVNAKKLTDITNQISCEVNKALGLEDTKIDWLHYLESECPDPIQKPLNPVGALAKRYRCEDAEFVGYIICWVLGVAFGRWDIRYATGEQAAPELPDPFAPLPVCPPGQLQNAQGLPARPEDVPASYPLKNIPWDGILVDDPNHPLDIEHRVREVIEIIWNGKEGGPSAEAIEHEACEILGVKSLRDYFRKSAGFFADHLKRYSKSRRQAPIYWPLSTKSGSYTLWIYYHRLTDQTLHTCLIDFVIPKLKSIGNEIGNLRESKITGERLEALLELQEELSDFKAELEEIIKLPWKPNLNDGVIINAAPLWKLFRLPAWQKKLKATWEELTKGDYDWAHLAYTIWPERVKDACKTDRSMAIAHGLEHLCTIEAPKAKAKRKVKASSEDGAELDLFSNAPEIEEAEESITIPPKGRKSTAKKPVAGEKVTRPRGRPAKAPKSDNPQGDK